ncbi:hypothetical protein GCM10010149_92560 [Nonomuraea roseoviolacea subsp. roseoviolacea]
MREGMKCPDCGAALSGTGPQGPVARCPKCALPLRGPAAHELWLVDQTLAELRDRQARLQARRTELLGILRAGAPTEGAAAAQAIMESS